MNYVNDMNATSEKNQTLHLTTRLPRDSSQSLTCTFFTKINSVEGREQFESQV